MALLLVGRKPFLSQGAVLGVFIIFSDIPSLLRNYGYSLRATSLRVHILVIT